MESAVGLKEAGRQLFLQERGRLWPQIQGHNPLPSCGLANCWGTALSLSILRLPAGASHGSIQPEARGRGSRGDAACGSQPPQTEKGENGPGGGQPSWAPAPGVVDLALWSQPPPSDVALIPSSAPVGPQTRSTPTCQARTFAVLFPGPFPTSCVG